MSFAQGAPTQPLVLQGSNVFLYGSSTTGNAFTVQQLSVGNVASFVTSTGATSLMINPAGNVGIGKTNPAYALDITGDLNFTGTFRQNGTPYIGSQWTGTTSLYFVGNVGIGTTNPATKLDIFTGTMNASTVSSTSLFGTHYGSISGSNITSTYANVATLNVSAVYQTLPISQSWSSITYASTSGIFVALASGSSTGIYTVNNGVSWSTFTLPGASLSWTSVATDGNLNFVAVASGTSTAAYSTNGGITWSASTMPVSQNWLSVTYGLGAFWAVGNGLSGATVSPGGSTWGSFSMPSSLNWNTIVYNGTWFVAISGGPGSSSSTTFAYSSSGSSWSPVTVTSGIWNTLAASPSYFVATNWSGTTLVSTNGSTWTSGGSLPGSWQTFMSYGGGNFIVHGLYSALAAYSTNNGTTWVSGTTTISSGITKSAYGGGVFIGLQSGSAVVYSTQIGATWGTSIPNVANPLTVGGSTVISTAFGSTATSTTLNLSDSATRNLSFILNATAGTYNQITAAGDTLLWYGGNAQNTGVITIAPWNSGYLGLRLGTSSNTCTIYSNVTSFVSNTNSTAMTIVNGNVGIGNSTPQTKLWVPANSTTTGIAVYNADVALIIGNTAGVSNSNTGSIQVKAGGSSTGIGTGNYHLTLNPDGGSVGVGVPTGTAFSYTFQVAGTVGASSSFTRTTGSTGVAFAAPGTGLASTDYNYILSGANDTANRLVVFVNGSARSADNGVSNVTIRNDAGSLFLGQGSNPTILFGSFVGIGTSSSFNAAFKHFVYGGDSSQTLYGPNTTYGTYLNIGTGTTYCAAGRASVNCSNGNLHIDCATGAYQIYLNYFQGGGSGGTNATVGCYAAFTATGDITAFSSDERLKTKVGLIENPLDKVCSLTAFKYIHNETARQNGFTDDNVYVGLSAQEVQKVLPEVVKPAPFDEGTSYDVGKGKSKSGENYLTIQYERIVSLLVEAVKEERAERLKVDESLRTTNERLARLEKLLLKE